MSIENRKGSVVTSIIAAGVFFLILAVFGRSIHGQHEYPPQTSILSAESRDYTVVGSGFYQVNVLEEAKYHFMPPLRNME